MLKVFLRLLLLIGFCLAVVAGIGSLLPRQFLIEQQVDIGAPVDAVFAKVNDLHHWLLWSPWRSELLGATAIQVGEPFAGSGAKMRWEDPRGAGKLWLTESERLDRIAFEFTAAGFHEVRGEFRFNEKRNGTQVTWACRGKLPAGPFYGFFGFMFRGEMERQFQASLQRLKVSCESMEREPTKPQ